MQRDSFSVLVDDDKSGCTVEVVMFSQIEPQYSTKVQNLIC